ncbi:MAG: cytochrome d ubiquinol oxidase subunit II [Prevotellaceae bacterium]|jgi:cytochrome d ubiquinol oxidase subunit II|nr:cytochrome d ubiquinol oxidase subunit II [Prevotellaceae bacterium]
MDTTYIFLQQYWWFLISLLGALLVFLMFVQGGQTLIYALGKTEDERTLIINCLGHKWEFTFTTLVTFGGAFFASFPLFYSTSFGGAYWVWMAILLFFVIQAVSYEFRSKANNLLGKKTYEWFLILNGLFGTVLVGTAVGTFFTGSMFSVEQAKIANLGGNMTISQWEGPAYGLEAVLNPVNVALGLTIFFLARILGALYIMNNIDNDKILNRSKKQLLYNTIPFLICFLFFVASILLKNGFGFAIEDIGNSKAVIRDDLPYKYFNNFIQMPVVGALFLIGVIGVLWGIGYTLFSKSIYTKGIWFTGAGTVLTVLALLLNVGLNGTAYYPSTSDLQSSLTIYNSSSSKFTLTAMSIVSLFIPFVLAYIVYMWRLINKKKLDLNDIQTESHIY